MQALLLKEVQRGVEKLPVFYSCELFRRIFKIQTKLCCWVVELYCWCKLSVGGKKKNQTAEVKQ